MHRPRMPRSAAFVAFVLLCAVPAVVVTAQRPPAGGPGRPGGPPTPEETREMAGCQSNLRNLFFAMQAYAQQNDGRLPPDLGSTLAHVPAQVNGQPATEATKAALFLCPSDLKGKAPAAKPDAKWVNQNTSYEYLGGADLKWAALPRDKQATTVVAHEKLAGPAQKHRGLCTLLYADGHVEAAPRPAAERLVAESKKTIDALRAPK